MPKIKEHRIASNRNLSLDDSARLQIKKNYTVLGDENLTASKSFIGKIKNFTYTLSSPFKASIKTSVVNSLGGRRSVTAMRDIRSPAMPESKSEISSTKSAKISADNNLTPTQSGYKIIGGKEGYRSQTFIERLWG